MTQLLPITDHDSRLAVELAVQISPLPEVLKRHGLTTADLRTKLRDPAFRHMVKEAKRTWQSDLSVKERIRLKSQVLVEDSLLGLYNIFHDGGMAAPARLDAFKQMARVATVDAPDKEQGTMGERISININLGDDKNLTMDTSVVAEA